MGGILGGMSTLLPRNPQKPVRSAFWYAANGNMYGLAIAGVLIGVVLKFRAPSEYREATVAAIGCAVLFVNFWWFAKKGMDENG